MSEEVETFDIPNCIVCKKEMTTTMIDHPSAPDRGCYFTSGGNYGSFVWDPMFEWNNPHLGIVVCDDCLRVAIDEQQVIMSHTKTTYESIYKRVTFDDLEME